MEKLIYNMVYDDGTPVRVTTNDAGFLVLAGPEPEKTGQQHKSDLDKTNEWWARQYAAKKCPGCGEEDRCDLCWD